MFHGLGRQNVRGTDGSLDFFMVTSAPSSILCFLALSFETCVLSFQPDAATADNHEKHPRAGLG